MYILNIRQTAKLDIQQIVDYYDEIFPEIATKFLMNLYADLGMLQRNPYLFQLKYKDTRVSYVKSFPFGIHYRIISNNIEILSVLHTSRNPKTWKNR